MGSKWDISNKQQIRFTEVQLVQTMIDGVKKLIALEEKLASAAPSADAAEAPAAVEFVEATAAAAKAVNI